MSSEKQLRGNVVKLLRGARLDARPVENPVDPGFPDVEYIGGLLELKEVDDWPARADTILRIEHYTQEQRIWHERRAHFGGRIHVLLQVEREYLLFTGAVAAQHLGRVPRATLYDLACARWPSLADLSAGLAVALKETG
jgi:hypothetical protein